MKKLLLLIASVFLLLGGIGCSTTAAAPAIIRYNHFTTNTAPAIVAGTGISVSSNASGIYTVTATGGAGGYVYNFNANQFTAGSITNISLKDGMYATNAYVRPNSDSRSQLFFSDNLGGTNHAYFDYALGSDYFQLSTQGRTNAIWAWFNSTDTVVHNSALWIDGSLRMRNRTTGQFMSLDGNGYLIPSGVGTNGVILGVAAGSNVTTTTNNGVVTVNATGGGSSGYINPATFGGRLTLVSGNPVVTTNATNSIIYCEPFNGNLVSLLSASGTAWQTNFQSLSLNLTNSGGVGAGTNIDIFIGTNSAGGLMLTNTLWTSDSARAVAISLTNGIYTISTNIIWRYIGTARTDTSNQVVMAFGGAGTNGVAAKCFLWNVSNRQKAYPTVYDITTSWSMSSTTIRAANASTSNRVSFVIGLPSFMTSTYACGGNSAGSNASFVGVGVDSTSSITGSMGLIQGSTSSTSARGVFNGTVTEGFHYFQACERVNNNGTAATWFGLVSGAIQQMALSAEIEF